MKVKLIIASTECDRVFFNYGDDYSDITRVLVEDHSEFEEIEDHEFEDLKRYVQNYNFDSFKKKTFAILIEADQRISAKSAISEIKKRREEDRLAYLAKIEKEKKVREEKAAKLKKEKELKTVEQKRKQLEKLKAELGEP